MNAEQLRWAAGWRAERSCKFLAFSRSRNDQENANLQNNAHFGTAEAVPFRLRHPPCFAQESTKAVPFRLRHPPCFAQESTKAVPFRLRHPSLLAAAGGAG